MSMEVSQPQQPKLLVGTHPGSVASGVSGADNQSFYTAHDGAKSGLMTTLSRRKSETEYMSVLDSNTPYQQMSDDLPA